MIEGETCPRCEKGKLKKVMDEIEPGIKVEAFKCSKCNEIWHSQEIMGILESRRYFNDKI